MKVLVSACMLGLNTRYDGKNTKNEEIIEYLKKSNAEFYPLCAEQLGGLCTPREPCEIEKGFKAKDVLNGKAKVFNRVGEDVTENFISGAKLVVNFCKEFCITHAILQDRSPSCGYSKVYDGTFEGTLIYGNGILTELLKESGIKILTI
jgi:uncharacterized protein YbbK (DUF523 family)